MSEPPSAPARPALIGAAWNAPYLLLTLTSLFWSGNFVVGRAVGDIVPPIGLAFWRWTVGLAIVVAVGHRVLRHDLTALVRSWPMLLLLSALGVACFNTFLYIGLKDTTAINALLLQSAMPLFILGAMFAIFREAPKPRQGLGVAVSIVGVAAIACHGDVDRLLSLGLNRGDVWVVAAVLGYAFYAALLRKRPRVHPLSFLAATFALGALILLPFYIAEHVSGAVVQAVPEAFLAIIYVAVFPAFLAYLFYNRGVELAGANTAGHFVHLMPIFGSALAIILLGEALRGYHILGAALIAAGLVIATRR